MSTCITTSKSNWFRVTDEDAYDRLIENLHADDVRTELQKDGTFRHFIGGYESIDYALRPSETKKVKDLIKTKKPIYGENKELVNYDSVDNHECLYADPEGKEVIYYIDCPDYNFDVFLEKLQKLLPDGEYFKFICVGNEKLVDVFGTAIFLTNTEWDYLTLEDWLNEREDLHCSNPKEKENE